LARQLADLIGLDRVHATGPGATGKKRKKASSGLEVDDDGAGRDEPLDDPLEASHSRSIRESKRLGLE
jgi:hypothetical protein